MFLLAIMMWSASSGDWGSSQIATAAEGDDAEALAGDDYVGITKCGACHYAQYKDWQATPHGKAFDILPTKYKNDASCLECHSTGAKQLAASAAPSLLNPADGAAHVNGVSCESCHGPGGKHARYALTFVGGDRQLSEESLKVLRSQIQRSSMEMCVQCHTAMAHKPHPKYDPEPGTRTTSQAEEESSTNRTGSFFQVHATAVENRS
jgi:hypothetical protein